MKTKSGLKTILTAVFASFLLVLTVTFAKFPASPSPIFIYCVCINLIQGDKKSLIISGVFGLLTDILCGNVFFSNACFFAYISLGCAELNNRLKCSIKTAFLCVFIATLLFSTFNVLVNFSVSNFGFWFLKSVLPEALVSSALTVIIYPIAAQSYR